MYTLYIYMYGWSGIWYDDNNLLPTIDNSFFGVNIDFWFLLILFSAFLLLSIFCFFPFPLIYLFLDKRNQKYRKHVFSLSFRNATNFHLRLFLLNVNFSVVNIIENYVEKWWPCGFMVDNVDVAKQYSQHLIPKCLKAIHSVNKQNGVLLVPR